MLLDLEPKVIETILESPYRNLFNPENMYSSICNPVVLIGSFVPKEGSGAGNNWGLGYQEADKYGEDLIDIITREAEDCDSFEVWIDRNFQL